MRNQCMDCKLWDTYVEMKYMDEMVGKGFCLKLDKLTYWNYACDMMKMFPENLLKEVEYAK